MPVLGDSLTPEKVVQFLSELFERATTAVGQSQSQSREYMAGDEICRLGREYSLFL